MKKSQMMVSWLVCLVAVMLFATPAAAECGALGIVTNIADSTVAAPGEVLLDDADIFILNLITESSVVVDQSEIMTKRVADGVATTQSQEVELTTTLGAVIGVSVSCTHQGCSRPEGCTTLGCDPLAGVLGCSAPRCVGVNCYGSPKGCTKTVTATQL